MFQFTVEVDEITNTAKVRYQGTFIEKYQEAAAAFWEVYDVDDIIIHPSAKPPLTPKASRTCAFCMRTMAEGATFRKDAHLIPQLMGNVNLISDEECDDCNSAFSKYETQLSYFMGLSRTLTYSKGQRGIPKFKTPDKNLIIGEMKNKAKGIIIESHGEDNNHFTIDEENKKMTIHAIKHPYKPIDCFKVFLKAGYIALPKDQRGRYERIRKILIGEISDEKIKGHPFFKLFGFLAPGPPIPSPVIFRFRKRQNKASDNFLSICYILLFQNYIYQFYMPLSDDDKWLHISGITTNFIRMAPFIDASWPDKYGMPTPFTRDLSGIEVVKNEPQDITMSFDNVVFNENPSQEEPEDEKQR